MMPEDVPVQHGFYRYSDILFHYHKVFDDPAEAYAFKAFVSHVAMGDPGHPLRIDKEKGIELYIGMLPNGQYRLMFSSAQIEYARYWLHEMGLTKKLLPLPSSDYLLTKEILRHWSPVHRKSSAEIKRALHDIEKSNKKLKGTDTALGSYRIMFDRVREFFASKKATWLAIDIEAWEYDHSVVTECGWSYIKWSDGNEVSDRGHYIVKENMIYTNGKFVPGARDKYKFGESKVLNKSNFKKEIRDMIVGCQKLGPLFLVFHDSNQDIKYLKGPYFNAPIDELSFLLPTDLPEQGTYAVDTSDLFGALEGDIGEKRSLGLMCRLLKVDTEHLHNAGNDAHYTLLALKEMASGNQIDAQREERWPNRTETSAELGSSFKVNHKPWDLDSDYSDLEGAFGPPPSSDAIGRHMAGLSVSDDDDD